MAAPTGDLDAAIAIGPITELANQRTNPPCLGFDRIERVRTRGLRFELKACMLVEQVERFLRGRVPVAVNRPGAAADTTKLRLQGPREIGLLLLLGLFSR